MKFSDLFKDKYKSEFLCKYLETISREMAELKRKNYYAQREINETDRKIKEIEAAYVDLGVPFKSEWCPTDEFEEYDDE